MNPRIMAIGVSERWGVSRRASERSFIFLDVEKFPSCALLLLEAHWLLRSKIYV